MYKIFFLILFPALFLFPQEDVKIMSYNILNYPGNDTTIRNPYFRTLMEEVEPDIIVVQEMHSLAGMNGFLNNILNVASSGYSMGTFNNGPDTDRGIFYKTAKFDFLSNNPISTELRDINQFTLVHRNTNDTLIIFGVHLKSSNTTVDEEKRGREIDSLRKVTNALHSGAYFIVLGDFNIYKSTETAYQKLLNQSSSGYFIDPISLTGNWNNVSYAIHHTQSPRTRSFNGGATGGLDDRFDLILYSQTIENSGGITFKPGSYHAYGNDGNHYNDSINRRPNTAVSDNIADALHYASDHIPVIAEFTFNSPSFEVPTYTWNGGTNGLFSVNTNWSPSRTSLSDNDILIFNSGQTITVTDVSAQTIGRLSISNNTNVTFQSSSLCTLTVKGGSGTDLNVESGSQLNISGSNVLIINLTTGARGEISGLMTFSGGTHKIISADLSGITFKSGSIFTAGTGFLGNAFGTTSLNSIIFSEGSKYIYLAGTNPFGASSPSSVIIFEKGSEYIHKSNTSPAFSGRSYADFVLEVNGISTASGSSQVIIDNLIIKEGTLNFNVTSNPGHSITGNIEVYAGQTLNFNPSSTGTILFNGTTEQTIKGAGTLTFNSLTNIEINNENNILLERNLTINGALILTNGEIILNGNTLTLNGAVTGSGTSGITQTTNLNAPVNVNVGNLGAIISSNANLGNTKVTRGYNSFTGTNNSGIKRWYKITPTNNSGLNATLVFPYNEGDELNGIPEERLRLFRSTDDGGTWTMITTNVTHDQSANTFTVTGLDGFSTWTLVDSDALLPVELTSFTATANGSNVNIKWTTATEVMNYGFEVQRTEVGEQKTEEGWEKIAFVEGHGNSNSVKEYSYTDKNVTNGKYNYRLKQIDTDGSFSYSNVIEVEVTVPLEFALEQNYPNPFNPSTVIAYVIVSDNGAKQFVKLKVYDILGNEVTTLVNETQEAGNHQVNFSAEGLPSGVYFYTITAGEFYSVKKMMLMK